MNQGSDFDPATLAKIEKKLGPRVLGEIIDLFCEHGPKRMRTIREGRQSGDLSTSADALHSIKGSAAMIGSVRLAELAHRMELMAGAGDVAGVTELVGDLETAFADSIAYYRERRKNLK